MVGPCGGNDQDWSTWMARTASAMLCFLVVLSIIVVDKSAEKVWEILKFVFSSSTRLSILGSKN